jgi:hypothetical protein
VSLTAARQRSGKRARKNRPRMTRHMMESDPRSYIACYLLTTHRNTNEIPLDLTLDVAHQGWTWLDLAGWLVGWSFVRSVGRLWTCNSPKSSNQITTVARDVGITTTRNANLVKCTSSHQWLPTTVSFRAEHPIYIYIYPQS